MQGDAELRRGEPIPVKKPHVLFIRVEGHSTFPSRAAVNGSVMNLESSEREDHQVRVIDAENVGYS